MMVIYILLLSILKDVNGIDCIYWGEPYEYPLNNFTYENFQMEINKFPSYDYQDDMCRVEIYIESKSGQIIISFADSFQWYPLDDGEARLDFLITFDKNTLESEYFNALEYACYDVPQCDKLFVFNHIQWLLQVNYSIFENQLKLVLLKNINKTESCFNDKTNRINCSNGVCIGKYSTYYQNYYYECYENLDAPIEVHITTTMSIQSDSEYQFSIDKSQMIRYICKFNQCNNQNLTDLIVGIVKENYQLKEMEDAFLSSYSIVDYSTQTTIQIPTEFSSSSSSSSRKSETNKCLSLYIANKYFFITIIILFDILI